MRVWVTKWLRGKSVYCLLGDWVGNGPLCYLFFWLFRVVVNKENIYVKESYV